jgi:hypothetical protein
VLHEIGHYLLHVVNPNRKRHPRIFEIDWNIWSIAKLFSHIRRHIRYAFNQEADKEWEADLWAMCAIIYFSGNKRVGCLDELVTFLEHNPDKWQFFLLRCVGMGYQRIKTGWQKLTKLVLFSFRTK